MSPTPLTLDADTPAVPPAPSAPPLLQRLVEQHGATWVTADSVDAWLAQAADQVLLIAGDAVRFPEGQDVAVVLPELQRHATGPAAARAFGIGVAEPAHEDALARRFGAARRPSLVFVRDGQYVTTLSGMLDWTDFVRAVNDALSLPTRRAPIGIAAAGGDDATCH